MRKRFIILTLIMVLCKVMGFLREALMANYFGVSDIVDAYIIAITIPSVAFGWITSISTAFMPVYASLTEENGESKAKRFVSMVLNDILLLGLVLAVLGFVFAPYLVKIMAPGFSGNVYNLSVTYLKITMWCVILICPCKMMVSYLDYHNKSIASNATGLVFSSIQILVILICSKVGATFLAVGALLSYCTQMLFLLIISSKSTGLRFYKHIGFTPEIKYLVICTLPALLGCIIQEINALVDKSFASTLAEGSIASLNYSFQIFSLLYYVFSSAIMTMSYPKLCKAGSQNDNIILIDSINQFAKPLIILFIPITVGGIILAHPIIKLVYERGAFTQQETLQTYKTLQLYLIGLMPMVLNEYIMKVCYARKKLKINFVINTMVVLVNILLNIILIQKFKVYGLAFATALSTLVALPIGIIYIKKKIGNAALSGISSIFLKCSFAAVVMGICVYFINDFLYLSFSTSNYMLLFLILLCMIVGAVIYFLLLMLLRVNDVKFLIHRGGKTR